jgi:RND superfamily putative drug exporter
MIVVRLFLVLPLARVLGPWFWWPQRIPSRPGAELASAAAM